MEPNPESAPFASEIDARVLFGAKLAALTARKFEAENSPDKKRRGFLTGRFFGGTPKQDTASTENAFDADAEPSNDTLDSQPNPPGHEQSVTADAVADAATEMPAPTIHATEPPADPTPAGAADLPPPRITLPSHHHSHSRPTPTQMTNHSPASGHASAQLTLGFEITSLQLTPFFRLGSVQLKALSNVVSLDLVSAGQADQPLAAGISFQIDRVELNDAAHLKSIVLKPLGESHAATALQPKLRVDGVAVAGGGENAPISVTTSASSATAVQLIGTFKIAAIEFSPAFEIDLLRLDPVSNTALLRVAPSSGPDAHALPSSFEFAEVQLNDGARIAGARLVPSTATRV